MKGGRYSGQRDSRSGAEKNCAEDPRVCELTASK